MLLAWNVLVTGHVCSLDKTLEEDHVLRNISVRFLLLSRPDWTRTTSTHQRMKRLGMIVPLLCKS